MFTIRDCPPQHLMPTSQLTICHSVIMDVKVVFFFLRTVFDNGKAPHVHNKSIMCNFIFIQSILLSHCELNTFFFLFCFFFVFFARSYKGYLSIFLYLLIIWQNCIGKKGSSSFNKLCLSTACGKGMSFLKHLICFLKSLFL